MHVETMNLYEDRKDVTLTTYIIAEQGELFAQGIRPAVLICPGGGYFSCSDREAEPVALKFASMGYHAFVLRYSTYGEGSNVFPDLSDAVKLPVKNKTKHPAPVRDIAKAMLCIHEKADEWQVDVKRVAVCGFSAGAHNTAMYSVYWDKPLLTEYFGVEEDVLRPAAIILGYTLSDYIFMGQVEMNAIDTAFFTASKIAFLGEMNPSEEKLKEVSPALLVTKKTPPAFIWATAADALVPVQHSLRLAHALADCGVPFEVHIFEEGDHGLSVSTQASAMAQSQIDQDAAKWVEMAECWLQKRFKLELPEKTTFEMMLEQQK